jgi:hypothetical protein
MPRTSPDNADDSREQGASSGSKRAQADAEGRRLLDATAAKTASQAAQETRPSTGDRTERVTPDTSARPSEPPEVAEAMSVTAHASLSLAPDARIDGVTPASEAGEGNEIGRYARLEQIGAGGFGVVYRARDTRLQRDVAIKVLREDTPEELRGRFLAEARRLASLDHPGICRVYDFGCSRGIPFLVTEWLPGPALDAEPLPMEPARACRLVADVADAVAFAHRHEVIHRDLKPANIVIDGEGRPRVIDFGLAAHEHDLTSSGREISGSPAYMSPEQIAGKLHVIDPRSDIWALGVVLYELVTGKRPFRGNSGEDLLSKIREKPTPPARTYNEQIPRQLERILTCCLRKDPQQRFATAGELASELRNVIDERPPSETAHASLAPPPATHANASSVAADIKASADIAVDDPRSPPPLRRTWLASALAVVVGCFLLLLGVWGLRGGGNRTGDGNDRAAADAPRDVRATDQNASSVAAPDSDAQMAASAAKVAAPDNMLIVEGLRPATGNRWTLSTAEPVAPNIEIGDRISLRVRLRQRRHVYLIWLGDDSGITPLYPGPLGSMRQVGVAATDRPIDSLNLSVGTITPTPSTETVLMLATERPFTGAAELRALLAVLPRPRLERWASRGQTRGVHFDAESWQEQAPDSVLLSEAYQPLHEFVDRRFGENTIVQAVSFVSGLRE